MNRFIKSTIAMVALLFSLSLAACGDGDDEEKSAVEQFTDRTAEEAVRSITEPVGRARAAQELANQKVEEINRAAEEAAD